MLFVLIIVFISACSNENKNTGNIENDDVKNPAITEDTENENDENSVTDENTDQGQDSGVINNEENINQDSEENNVKEKLLETELIQNLYKKIYYHSDFRPVPNIYQNKKITYEDLDTLFILYWIDSAIPFYTTFPSYVDENLPEFDESRVKYKVPIEVYNNMFYEIFGNKTKIDYVNYSPADSVFCDFKGDEYICYQGNGGGYRVDREKKLLIDAKIDGENVYLYDIYAFMKDSEKYNKQNIYADSSLSILLKENQDIDWDISDADFIEKYRDIMQPYKHTFKKNADGSYYWYSTEMLDYDYFKENP
jgi:hypothetical protein